MSVIQKLPESLANKIAAGEVVQRPESVVKELIENSLDAGATELSLVIKNAGKSLIFVRDNGCGMSLEDALLCFERHATSKIKNAEDLDRIITLGFRGEALAAIASVAQVELKTKRNEDELGVSVKIENGEVVETDKINCEVGTTISIKNLFFSVPARRKFLKSNPTEFKHISEVMQRFALCYPSATFTFSDDDTLIFHYPATSIEGRISDIYGNDFNNALIPYQAQADGILITGFIGKPNFAKRTKADQYFFLNGRYISSKNLSHAVFTGYEHLLTAQSYPPYILFIEIDPEKVDVNVHPTKSEVKFDDETMIYKLLQEGTRSALKSTNLVPSMNVNLVETGDSVIAALRYALPQFDNSQTEFKNKNNPTKDYDTTSNTAGNKGLQEYQNFNNDKFPINENNSLEEKKFTGGSELVRRMFEGLENNQYDTTATNTFKELKFGLENSASKSGEEAQNPQKTERIFLQQINGNLDEERGWILQLHNKYILTQIRSGLMIIDQHVAHERILYEKALAMLSSAMPKSQQLLFAIELKITPTEQALVRELRQHLLGIGFDFNLSDNGKVKINGVPSDIRAGLETNIFKEILEQYQEYQTLGKSDIKDMIAASFGCRGAIKAGDRLSEKEQRALIDELFATSMPYVCPHGRPIVTKIDLVELDRRFGRTS